MKKQAVEFQVQEGVAEVPWPFSYEVVAGRFSKQDEQVLEGEELLEELDPQVAPVAPVVLL